MTKDNHHQRSISPEKLAEYRQDYLREMAFYPWPAPTFEVYVQRRLEDQYGPMGEPTRAFG